MTTTFTFRTPDDAQHLSRDIFAMLGLLEENSRK